ncbi:hypothetical protein IDM48_01630 [Rothia amarae]|uniref:Uncharacterized protein n=1 Tax=Rothia amarae TaxID=169480 RepID=A0A7H2BKH9_9MICC|nr:MULTISPECIES: hypothetical protein [Rothia]QNV40175.1 hypothetical protein IDM48_01630 [Rothia amarae]
MSTPQNPNHGEKHNDARPFKREPNRVLPEEPPAQTTPSKKPAWPWVIGLLLLSLLIWGGCALVGNVSNNESVRVELKTTSSTSGTVYYGPDDSIVAEDFAGEWDKTVEDIRPQDSYGLRAKSEDSSATVSCEISVDGVVQSQAEATNGEEASCKLPDEIKK